ncbi:MAG: hypothetical protein HW390_1524 [Candidatus Brocadiaceae bacterium]|nr:hypothetical protein [Candidatus Brocadiaceae bacterium]
MSFVSKQTANKSKVVFSIISQGNCIYAAMTRVAVASLRLSNPSLHLVVACDHETDIAIRRAGNPLIGEVDEWVVTNTPPGNAGFRSRFVKTRLRSLIEGSFLFLDSDIFVCGDLSEIFTLNADIAGARNHSRAKFNEQVAVQDLAMLVAMGWKFGTEVYVNSGVLYYNDTPGTYRFADEWHRRWMQSFARFEDHRDQPAMNFALHDTQPSLAVLPDRFNAQFKFTPGVAAGAVIWHYYASLNKPPHTSFERLANDLMHGAKLDKEKTASSLRSFILQNKTLNLKLPVKVLLKKLLPKATHNFCRKILYGKFYALRLETDGLLSPEHQPEFGVLIMAKDFLDSQVFPLNLPLAPDERKGWRGYPVFKGCTRNVNTLSCHVSALTHGNSPHPPHTHRDEEILLLLSGEADIILREDSAFGTEQRRRLKPGHGVYYPSQFSHTIVTISREPAQYFILRWTSPYHTKDKPLAFRQFDLNNSALPESGIAGFRMGLVLEGPTGCLRKLHCHTSTLSPGAGYAPHTDVNDVVIMLLAGEIETLGQRVSPHSIVFYPAGKPHGMRNPGTAPAHYVVFEFHGGEKRTPVMVEDRFTQLRSVCIEASTVCQLKCPSCPTASGIIANRFGSGFLTFDHFRRFIDENRSVSAVELSNWGEIFLNPQLKDILRYAYKKNVVLTAYNGVNLNHANEDVLDALVRYKFRSLSCSIDGDNQETYSTYRVNGNFDNVIKNIRTINAFKKKYKSPYPQLQWQYIAFGHNEHAINMARFMAMKLGMKFYLKLNWEGLYATAFSPVNEQHLIRRKTGLGVADRKEYEEKFGRHFAGANCHLLWIAPRINFDGKLLGCSINHWGDYGNVFEKGLSACLTGEKIEYARQMVQGRREAKEGIPCTDCEVYRTMKVRNAFVRPEELAIPQIEGRLMNFLRNRFSYPALISLRKALAAHFGK